MSHKCHARGCDREVPPAKLMCLYHWGLVPRPLRDAVRQHYVKGQEITKTPTAEYLNAARAAIEAVAEREGR